MKKKTRTLIKTLVSGAAGALILPAGMYLLAASSRQSLAAGLADPGGWVSGTGSVLLIAISAVAAGAIMVMICNPPGFISSARHSIAAGFLSGVFLWLGSSVLSAHGMSQDSIILVLSNVLLAITGSIPFFAMFCVAFALVAILGGMAAEVVMVVTGKVIGHKTAA